MVVAEGLVPVLSKGICDDDGAIAACINLCCNILQTFPDCCNLLRHYIM